MATVKRVRFLCQCAAGQKGQGCSGCGHREGGALVYVAGRDYPVTPLTESLALQGGVAELVDVEMDEAQHVAQLLEAESAWAVANRRSITADAELRARWGRLL